MNFLVQVLSTVIGGLLFTYIFFLIRDNWFGFPRLCGKWEYIIKTTETAYRKYQGMELKYNVALFRDGNKLYGTAEKLEERVNNEFREFIAHERSRGEVTGVYQRNFFKKYDLMNIHIKEQDSRESTYFCSLICSKKCWF